MRLLSLALAALALFCAPKSQAQVFTQTMIGVDRGTIPSPVCIMSSQGTCAALLGTWNTDSGAWSPAGLTNPGTVTSVNIALPLFTFTGCPVTTSGTCVGALNTQAANQVLAGPTSGAAAAPAFRALVGDDLPLFTNTKGGAVPTSGASASNWVLTVSGWAAPVGGGNVSNGGTPTNGQLAQWTGSTTIQGITPGTGVVTALQLAANATGAFLTTPSGACTSGQFLTFLTPGSLPTCQTPAGSGNVSNSGTPSLGQLAEWINATQVQGATIGSGLKLTGSTITAPGYTSVYDVTNSTYGCTPSTTSADADQAPCIQTAINAAATAGGGVVWVPIGYWNLNSQITVKPGVTLQCANHGYSLFNYNLPTISTYGTPIGTVFDIQWGSGAGSSSDHTKAAIIQQSNSEVNNCGFWYRNQLVSAATPIEYGASIMAYDTGAYGNTSQRAINNWCYNCYYFIRYLGGDAPNGLARAVITGNQGSPIYVGIGVNFQIDWLTVANNSFNSGELQTVATACSAGNICGWVASNGAGHYVGHGNIISFDRDQVFGYQYDIYADFQTNCCIGISSYNGPIILLENASDGVTNGVYINAPGAMASGVRILGGSYDLFNPYVASPGVVGSLIGLNATSGIAGLQINGAQLYGYQEYILSAGAGNTLQNVLIQGNFVTSTIATASCIVMTSGTASKVSIAHNQCNNATTPVNFTVGAPYLVDNQGP